MKYNPTTQEKRAFIDEVAPLAQKAYKTLGKILPSVCIGMACLESGFGYGTDGSRLMYKHNAVLGQKVGSGKTALKYWSRTSFSAKTNEEYTVGVLTTLPAASFRSYVNLEQCIFNYYELLNTSLYKKVLGNVDYKTQMAQIKLCGYMTSSTEVNSVINIIKEYGLTIYDDGIAVTQNTDEYIIGRIYTTQSDLYIRYTPNGDKLEMKSLTTNAQMNAFTDEEGYSVLKKGTRVTCKALKDLNNSTWMQIPSGWICAKNSSNVFVK